MSRDGGDFLFFKMNLFYPSSIFSVNRYREGFSMTQSDFEAKVAALTQTLYRVSAALLPRLCDRQDAVQSSILLAWRNRYRVRDERTFRPWIVRILINECHAIHRKNRRIVLTDAPEAPNPVADALTVHLRDQALHEAVQGLPEKHRLTVVLHYMEGASMREISSILRVPVGTVKSRLNTARGILRDALREEV